MKDFARRLLRKQSPAFYASKDVNLVPSLGFWDLLALGVGMVVGTSIFTLPGIVAAEHTGPAVPLAFLIGAVGAGMASFAYAEMSSVLPFAGSAFSWLSILFGEFFGWVTGWALLAEYFLSVAFVASVWSAYMQGFLTSLGIHLPTAIAGGLNPAKGSYVDLLAVLAILFVGILLNYGAHTFSRVENTIVVLKIAAVMVFIIVGFTAVHAKNYVPFVPAHRPGTTFGGVTGLIAGAAQVFLSYVGFDALAANTAEVKNPGKTMPRVIIGTLIIGSVLFMLVSLVLVGMYKYTTYAGNAEPAAWALRHSGHYIAATILSTVALVGMFAALIGIHLASSRLLYSFGRDGLLPSFLGKTNKRHQPGNALNLVTLAAIIVAGFLPFSFLSNLVSAGTLIAFIMVSFGVYALRRREGVDLRQPTFKMPGYPVLPALSGLFSMGVFMGLSSQAKLLMLVWFAVGVLIYLCYGIRHSVLQRNSK